MCSTLSDLPQIKLLNGDVVIDEELAIFSNVTGRELWPTGNLALKKKVGNDFVQDEFDHEQYLIVSEKCNDAVDKESLTTKKVLISGCAHNGILNILEHYQYRKDS